MKIRILLPVLISVACLVAFDTGVTAQQTDSQPAWSPQIPVAAKNEAAEMVPAEAVLDRQVDARKVKAGDQFRATLTDSVHLKNGPELPHGTILVGTIAADQMQNGGNSKLALRFTEARLKNGKTFPIEATIVAIAKPAYGEAGYVTDPVATWDGRLLATDEVGVMSGVDLHSRIAGEYSGVFVTKKTDVKLAARLQLALAIGAQSTNGANGA